MDIFRLLRQLTQVFDKLKIDYMLGGSVAMNFYAVSRSTQDIDLVVNLKELHIKPLLQELKHFYLDGDIIKEMIRHESMFNIIDYKTGIKADFIILKNTVYNQHAFTRRKPYHDLGFEVYVTSLEDLIIAKVQWIQELFSGRQAQDIRLLLKNNTKDLTYLKKWCRRLNLNTFDFTELK